jgi:hypothetical protein
MHDCLAEQVQMKQLPVVEQVSILGEPVNQRPSIRTSVRWDRSIWPECAIGNFYVPQKAAGLSVTDSISRCGFLEMTGDALRSVFEILLGKQAPLRSRHRVPSISQYRCGLACWALNLALRQSSLPNASVDSAFASIALPVYGKFRNCVALFAEYPLKRFCLAIS